MHYPAWKYLLILLVLIISTLYALPNFYPDQPAVQISGARAGTTLDASVSQQAQAALQTAGVPASAVTANPQTILLRFQTSDQQLKAQEALLRTMGNQYSIAPNLAPTTPQWLRAIGATPMKLGLDLRGGVHFLMQVDMQKALAQRLDTAAFDVRRALRENNLPFTQVQQVADGLNIEFTDTTSRDQATALLRRNFADFDQRAVATPNGAMLALRYTPERLNEISRNAVDQNMTTIRNRVNELGVAEALVQTQGSNRIVVDLPGLQDTAEAKRAIGRTASLEMRMVSDLSPEYEQRFAAGQFKLGDPTPPGTEAFPVDRIDSSRIVLLNKEKVVTGDRIQDANATFDPQDNSPQVSIRLDAAGGQNMASMSRRNIGKLMAVVFIENKQRVTYSPDATGKMVATRIPYDEKVVINQATIQDILGSSFVINRMSSSQEADELAKFLRAGSLAAPMYFVEERIVGPTLGQENIDKGLRSTLVGFVLVALFMLVFYRLFGLIANIALLMNVAMILAVMSAIGAALSLPGIAGIVLTIGMAVDANVLIFERIREELRRGANPRSAIVAGYERAWGTILDSNLTTLIVAVILFAVGSGPVKGFAVTLAIGILCSMFTAITVSRGLVQLVYGRRGRIAKLSI